MHFFELESKNLGAKHLNKFNPTTTATMRFIRFQLDFCHQIATSYSCKPVASMRNINLRCLSVWQINSSTINSPHTRVNSYPNPVNNAGPKNQSKKNQSKVSPKNVNVRKCQSRLNVSPKT